MIRAARQMLGLQLHCLRHAGTGLVRRGPLVGTLPAAIGLLLLWVLKWPGEGTTAGHEGAGCMRHL